MKKILMFCLSLTVGIVAAVALPKGASSPRLLLKTDQHLMAPVWSPSGDKIAVTTDNYTGILVADASGTNLRRLTSDAGVGYKMTWTADGSRIVGRTNVAANRMVLHELKAYDVASAKSSVLVAKNRFDGTPAASQVRQLKNGGSFSPTTVFEMMLNKPADVASSVDGLRQFKGSVVINPALSPDGTKIAFQIAGKGIFVCNADGSNVVSLCKGSYPSWLADNRTIVMTVVTDDGMKFTSSTLYAIDVVNGSKVTLLQNSGYIPRMPAVSPDGSTVAFVNSKDSSIYTITLKY
ncbi:MAG: PD40 domain-containing protein [Muribaculaceae bacterium]|nr:PD40 domain-containing protein [Muribaculaceae bacterium]